MNSLKPTPSSTLLKSTFLHNALTRRSSFSELYELGVE